MSLVFNKDMNFSGTSQIDPIKEGEMPVIIMTMNANYNNSGSVNISKTIYDLAAYNANKEMAIADYKDFEARVYATIGLEKETEEK